MTVTVYTLSDSSGVRYVGVTRHPANRAKQHCHKKYDRTRRSQWLKSLHARGENPIFEVLDLVPRTRWQFWEQHWIQMFRGWGFKLVNSDNGGLGRMRTTRDIADKISATLTGREQPHNWKPVHSYGLDGRYVESFDSLKAAAKATNTNHPNILRAIKNNGSSGGRLWSYEMAESIKTRFVNGKIPHITPPHVREMLLKMSIGKVVSQETRMKQRLAKLGKKRPQKIAVNP